MATGACPGLPRACPVGVRWGDARPCSADRPVGGLAQLLLSASETTAACWSLPRQALTDCVSTSARLQQLPPRSPHLVLVRPCRGPALLLAAQASGEGPVRLRWVPASLHAVLHLVGRLLLACAAMPAWLGCPAQSCSVSAGCSARDALHSSVASGQRCAVLVLRQESRAGGCVSSVVWRHTQHSVQNLNGLYLRSCWLLWPSG